MEKIKVLMLVPNLFVANGVASFVMNYLNNMDHDAVQIDVVTYKEGESIYYSEVVDNGGKVFFVSSIKEPIKHLKECRKILEMGQYDIVHDNTLLISIPMMWYAKKTGIPVRILHSHNSKMGETKAKEIRNKFFLPFLRMLATDYAACSHGAGSMMFGCKPFTVITNVIQPDKYKFDGNKRKFVRERMNVQNKSVIGTVGRLAIQKNPFFAVDVFEHLLEKMPNAEYWWIGSETLDEQVKSYVEKKKLADKVKLLGNRDDCVDLYQAMDCFFMPSLFEGLPLTGVEAQAMGLPMVVSDTVTSEMKYTDLITYVSLDAPLEEWVNSLENALHENVDRNKGSASLKNSHFSDVRCGDRLKKLYIKCLEKKGNL